MFVRLLSAFALAATAASAQTASQPAAEARTFTDAEIRTANQLIDKALADDTAWKVVESLTTEIGPRLAGSEAEARARDWGAAKLKALGFKNVRIETYDMPYWSRTHEKVEIVSPFAQPLIVTALGNSPATPEGGVTGEVVRFSSYQALVDAPMTGLEGKIVFVDEKMTRTQDGSGYGVAVAKRGGASREGKKRGAVAALIRSVGTDSHRNPHTGSMGAGGEDAFIPAAALSAPDADQLARALRLADGKPVTVKVDIGVERKASVVSGNVIGEIPGQTDEIVLIGGHLDSWDLGTGAIDDGAGVAITAAAAKLVGDLPGKPKRTIRVIMWGAEEVGLFGARAYAEAHKGELSLHHAAGESDFGAGRIWQFSSRFGEGALPVAKAISRALHRLGVGPGGNYGFGGPDVSPLRAAGVPIASLEQDGLDYFDLHHTPDDTLDKIDPEDLKQNVAAWAATIWLLSETEGSLRNPSPTGAGSAAN
ncbi:MAG: M20/M25/M40 family metallo-hydrolase [Amphiplicatus sp.]